MENNTTTSTAAPLQNVIQTLEKSIDELNTIGSGSSSVTPKFMPEGEVKSFETIQERLNHIENNLDSVLTYIYHAALPIGAGVGSAVEQKVQAREPQQGQGQNGPKGVFPWKVLNQKEKAVLRALNGTGKGRRKIMSLEDLAEECFMSEARDPEQANSWVRNSLRRLVRGEWVENMNPGVYRICKGEGRTKVRRKYLSTSDTSEEVAA